jgi:hypothetical protein
VELGRSLEAARRDFEAAFAEWEAALRALETLQPSARSQGRE